MNKPKLKHLDTNKKYIIATDLDHTFLTHDNSGMLIDNYRAVKAVKESGNYFVIATGRSWWSTKMVYEQLDLDTPSINFSGVYVNNRKMNSKENIADELEIYLDKLDRDFIIKFVNKFELLKKTNEFAVAGKKYVAFFDETSNINDLFFDSYELILEMKSEYSTTAFANEVRDYVEPRYQLRIWNDYVENGSFHLVISPTGTNKAYGLAAIAKQLNVAQENVIYFGDNINDIEALKWAGYSIVPANAIVEAKLYADEILELPYTKGAVAKRILDLIYG